MKITLIPNTNKENYIENTTAIAKKLITLGAQVNLSESLSDKLKIANVRYISDDAELLSCCDIVIAIGGDGTIIHAARMASVYKKPVLGINAGRIGYLAGLEMSELDELESLQSDKFKVEKRMMLKISIEGSDKSYFAINDCVISRGMSGRLADFELSAEEQSILCYRADGIIAGTPTGSTGYSLSAGGPIIDPLAECILITPICAHSLTSRPILFGADARLNVNIPGASADKGILTIDGEIVTDIEREQRVFIEKSDIYAFIIRRSNTTFYKTLQDKLSSRRK